MTALQGRFFYSMNKSTILQRVSSHVNNTSEVPTGDLLLQWSDFLETANQEWCTAYEPQVLIKTFHTTMAVSGTSVALPDDFKRFAGFITINSAKVEERDPREATITSGDYVTWGGNQDVGIYMTTQALTSPASIAVPYHSKATALSTLTSTSPIPTPEFLVMRVTHYAKLARQDADYTEFKDQADLLLARMVGDENTSDLQKNKTIRTQSEYKGFRLGDD